MRGSFSLCGAIVLGACGSAELCAQSLRFEVPALRSAGWVHGALPCRPGEFPAGRVPRWQGDAGGLAWVIAEHPDGSPRWIGISAFSSAKSGAIAFTSRGARDLASDSAGKDASANAPAPSGAWAACIGPRGSVQIGRIAAESATGRCAMDPWSGASVGPASGGPWTMRLDTVLRAPEGAVLNARAARVLASDGRAVRLEGYVHAAEASELALRSVRVEIEWSGLGVPRSLPFRDARQVGSAAMRIDGEVANGNLPERIAVELPEGTLVVRSPGMSRLWPCGWRIDERGLALELLTGGAALAVGESVSFALEAAWLGRDLRVDGDLVASPRRVPSRSQRRAFERAPAAASLPRFLAWSNECAGGRRDFGDVPLEAGGNAEQPILWSNGEFDLALGLLRGWWSGGSPACCDLAAAAVRHAFAIDVPAAGDGGERRGLPWRHGVDHGLGGAQDLGHTWIEGWIGVGRVRGDPLALDAAFAAADAIARATPDPRRDLELERTYAWPVIALAAAASEAPGERWEVALADFGSELLLAFDRSTGRFAFEGRRRAYSPISELHVWLSAGLLGEALAALGAAHPRVRARLRGPTPREVGAALLATLWSEAWDPSARRFAARVRWTAAGAQRIGVLRGVPEAYALYGLELLAKLARDEAALRRARDLREERGSELGALRDERWWNDFALAGRCTDSPLESAR